MKCKRIHKKLIFFLDNELPVEKMEQIRLHLDECDDCKQFLNEMKATFGVFEEQQKPEINPFFYTRLKAKLDNQTDKEKDFARSSVFTRILQPALFSTLLVIGIYSGLKIGQIQHSNNLDNTVAEQELIPFLNEMGTESIETFLME